MDRSHVAQLIAVTYKQDAIAQQVKAETAREVFCHIASVSAAEFFDAGRSGLRAALKITVFDADYHGESIAVVDGVRYGIYRTYRAKGEQVELYLEEKAGV